MIIGRMFKVIRSDEDFYLSGKWKDIVNSKMASFSKDILPHFGIHRKKFDVAILFITSLDIYS